MAGLEVSVAPHICYTTSRRRMDHTARAKKNTPSTASQARSPRWLQRAAHRIKGSLANLGAAAACETAMKLESMGADNRLEQAEATFEELVDEVRQFELEAEKHRKIHTP